MTLIREQSLSGDETILSGCGAYRYWLTRGEGLPVLGVIMLNPSTANAFTDDPTIRRLRGFAERWGYKSIVVGNLFAYRSPDPTALHWIDDPERIGRDNDRYVGALLLKADAVLVAWGASLVAVERARRLVKLASALRVELQCLGTTASGAPIHPMARGKHRVPDDAVLVPWKPTEVING